MPRVKAAAGSPAKKAAKKATKYKKAPDAPKRFKSAFIIFSAEKHREIKKKLVEEGRAEKTTDIAKLVSESWKTLPAEEREVWEGKAEEDRARYETEKANYKGPWKIPANNKRSTKDPTAPKRPMSAFLAYSNSRRAELKRKNPKATNADLSKMLSKSWKELDPQERAVYMEEEAGLRAKYKTDMAVWRKKAAKQKKAERVEQEEMEPEEAPVPAASRAAASAAAAPQSDNNAQMQQQLMEQMQLQQQEQFMNSMGGGMAGMAGMGGNDAMGQMTMEQQQALMQQQREMLAGAGDASGGLGGMGMGGDPNSAAAQQNMNGLFGGNNPYALQGLGGFGGGPMGGAFGFNAGAGNPYLALANQAAFMQGGGQAGSLSALMGQNFGNPMGQMGNQGLNQGQGMGQMNQGMGMNMNQGFYGNNLGGYGLGNFGGGDNGGAGGN